MPSMGSLVSMASKAMGSGDKKKESKEGDDKANWEGVGSSAMKAAGDGKVTKGELADIGKKAYGEYKKDKNDGTAPKPKEIGQKLIGGLFGKKSS